MLFFATTFFAIAALAGGLAASDALGASAAFSAVAIIGLVLAIVLGFTAVVCARPTRDGRDRDAGDPLVWPG